MYENKKKNRLLIHVHAIFMKTQFLRIFKFLKTHRVAKLVELIYRFRRKQSGTAKTQIQTLAERRLHFTS